MPLRLRIRDLSQTRVRYGYFRIYILLRREGWLVNRKRVYRLYREDGLSLRIRRPRRHVSAAGRERQPGASAPNELWSMDFVSDALFDGRRLRALTVVDAYTREALTIVVDQGIKGKQVVDAVTRIAVMRGGSEGHPCRQRTGVRLEGARSLGLRERRHAGLQPARQANRQRLRGIVQRPAARRMPEHTLVPVRWPTPGPRSKLGAGTTTRAVPHTSLGWKTPNEYAAEVAIGAAE